MQKTCETCYYGRGKKCRIMHSPIEGCWADEAEARKRAAEIKNYMSGGVDVIPANRVYKRPVKEKLDKDFIRLYKNNMNDPQIAKELRVSAQSVRNYRLKRGLSAHKKCRSTAKEA